ncbi:MAG: hypothetical protein A2Y50_07275 [Pseudomonadales bacterium RIFCSPLOWO2_12_59_9]|nr:MAG: hypothetical protein A2Y50_07275 [Pseudomonadales bacterium RIFCSPLOWO2_12_59_9]
MVAVSLWQVLEISADHPKASCEFIAPAALKFIYAALFINFAFSDQSIPFVIEGFTVISAIHGRGIMAFNALI